MGRTWYLLNIDARERSMETSCKLGEFFFDHFPELFHALALPILPREVDVWLKRGTRAFQPGPLGKLSTELLYMIFIEITDFEDIVNTAITSKFLLDIGKPQILRMLWEYHAPWAGDRLVCLGEYTDNAGLPPGLLTEAELQEVKTADIPYFREYHKDGKEIEFTTFATEAYQRHDRLWWWQRQEDRRSARKNLSKDRPRAEVELEREMHDALCIYAWPTYPASDAAWVLCNLSKGEYVREDALSETGMKTIAYGVDCRNFGLMHALLSRVCWSTDSSISMCCAEEYKERFTKGPWVGDRFCVTTLEDMQTLIRMPRAGKWKDVTAEVDELLVHLWKVNMVDD